MTQRLILEIAISYDGYKYSRIIMNDLNKGVQRFQIVPSGKPFRLPFVRVHESFSSVAVYPCTCLDWAMRKR